MKNLQFLILILNFGFDFLLRLSPSWALTQALAREKFPIYKA
jgi:hypothetical protein